MLIRKVIVNRIMVAYIRVCILIVLVFGNEDVSSDVSVLVGVNNDKLIWLLFLISMVNVMVLFNVCLKVNIKVVNMLEDVVGKIILRMVF